MFWSYAQKKSDIDTFFQVSLTPSARILSHTLVSNHCKRQSSSNSYCVMGALPLQSWMCQMNWVPCLVSPGFRKGALNLKVAAGDALALSTPVIAITWFRNPPTPLSSGSISRSALHLEVWHSLCVFWFLFEPELVCLVVIPLTHISPTWWSGYSSSYITWFGCVPHMTQPLQYLLSLVAEPVDEDCWFPKVAGTK